VRLEEKMGTELNIFTDGGCSGNPGPGGWAYIVMENEDRADSGPCKIIAEKWNAEESTTNNRMELLAVISALEDIENLALSPGKIKVYSDSQYVQKGITEWIKNWKLNNWINTSKKPVKNKDLWLRLEKIAGNYLIEWIWIRGHSGNEYNERCDQMTQLAIMSIKKGAKPV
jgi:ribonuclease HI